MSKNEIQLIKMGAAQTGESNKDYWQTPPELLSVIREYFHGTYFDPCPVNPSFDGLTVRWENYPQIFINPPFSQYSLWVKKGLLYTETTQQIWISHHNHDVKWFKSLREHSFCEVHLYNRVMFIDPISGLAKSTAIGKCQTLHFVGKQNMSRIKRYFSDMGQVMIKA